MSLLAQVETWRDTATTALQQVVADNPNLSSYGLSNDSIVDYVLGIVQQESKGIPTMLGDHILGTSSLSESQMTSIDAVTPYLDNYNSIGLGQLNFGAGTPQGLGYTGDKAGLLDGSLNLYYVTKNFLKLLNKYQGDISSTLSAYNAGHSIVSNILTYVQPIMNSLQSILSEKKITF